MGNTVEGRFASDLLKEREYNTGKKLFQAISHNSAEKIEECINFAKKEIKPDLNGKPEEDFELMKSKLTAYLTRKYDIGDGFLFCKTPVEYATSLNANFAINALNDAIARLIRHNKPSKASNIFSFDNKNKIDNNIEVQPSFSNGVDSDRVNLAKERLKSFQNKSKGKS
jgi:hypothetical protein